MNKLVLILFSTLFSLAGYANCDETQDLKNFGEMSSSRRVLLVPGLNFQPERFDDLISDLIKSDFQVSVLYLKYSSEKDRRWEDQNLSEHWVYQVKNAVCRIQQSSDPSKGFQILAYSLGAISTEIFLQRSEVIPEGLVKTSYLAPAFQVSWFLGKILRLSHILEESVHIPSWNLKAYRTRGFTYSGEYEALVDLINELREGQLKKLDIKHDMFISPEDELLDAPKVLAWSKASRKRLHYQEIKATKLGTIGKHHLVVDKKSLTGDDYNAVLNSIIQI